MQQTAALYRCAPFVFNGQYRRTAFMQGGVEGADTDRQTQPTLKEFLYPCPRQPHPVSQANNQCRKPGTDQSPFRQKDVRC